MNHLKAIRLCLGLRQQAIAQDLGGCPQSNVDDHERGQTLRSEVMEKLIEVALAHDLHIGFDNVHGGALLPEPASS